MFSRKDVLYNNLWATVLREAEDAAALDQADGIVKFVKPVTPNELIPGAHNNVKRVDDSK